MLCTSFELHNMMFSRLTSIFMCTLYLCIPDGIWCVSDDRKFSIKNSVSGFPQNIKNSGLFVHESYVISKIDN